MKPKLAVVINLSLLLAMAPMIIGAMAIGFGFAEFKSKTEASETKSIFLMLFDKGYHIGLLSLILFVLFNSRVLIKK